MSEKTRHIVVGKNHAVMGLGWRLEPVITTIDAVLKSVAYEYESDFGLAIESSSDSGNIAGVNATVGLLPKGEKPPKNAYSAAQWFVDFIDKPTILVKRFEDGNYWVVGGFPGESGEPGEVDTTLDLIVDEDGLTNALAAAIDVLKSDSVDYRLSQDGCTGDEAFIDDNASLVSIEEILEAKNPSKKARIIKIKPLVTFGGGVVLVLITALMVGGAGWYINDYYQGVKRDRELAEIRMNADRQAAMRKTLRGQRMLEAIQTALQTDTSTPPPLAHASNCYSAAVQDGPSTAGWALVSGTCTEAAFKAKWKLNKEVPSTDRMLQGAIPNAHWSFEPGGDNATNTITLKPAEKRKGTDDISTLPEWAAFNVALTSDLQLARVGNKSLTWKVAAPTTKSIKYVDPDKEGAGKAYEQTLSDVPPGQSYKNGEIKLTGKNIWQMAYLPIQRSNISVSDIKVTFTPAGEARWEINAQYIVQ